MANPDPDLIELFKEESRERLSHTGRLINDIRSNKNLPSALEGINRELHTIKGSVKMIGFSKLGTFVHEVEGITALLINPDGEVDADLLDLLEEACDEIANHVDLVIQDSQDRAPEELSKKIQDILQSSPNERTPSKTSKKAQASFPAPPTIPEENSTPSESPEPPPNTNQSSAEIHWSTPLPDPKAEDKSQERPETPSRESRRVKRPERPSKRRGQGSTEELVRVRSSKLSSLDTLVSDLIDSRLRFDHHERGLADLLRKVENREVAIELYQQFHEDRHHLNLIVKGLEQLAIDLRLRPLSPVFDTIARTGRDLARKFGKKVRIQISGENTELDRVILDGIRDPLAHVIRNVIDHGIEMPHDRVKAGKKEKGVVELAAYQDGVAVVIRIADDGAGVNTEKLKEKVIQKGLLTEEEVSKMSHKELIDLVFIPGLSTRAQATETSGRGVGMDVVRRNVEALKGEAHIDSKLGKGTIIELRVPLTLLVSRVLLTKVGDSIFAFATESLDSTESMDVKKYTEYAGMTVFKVRERHVPIVSLNKLLDLPEEENKDSQRRLAIVRHKEDLLALEIDEFVGERSVVIKPLGWPLVNVPAISGAVLLGSGEMALTVHVPGLIERFYQSAPKGQTKRLITREQKNRKIILVVDDSKIYRSMAQSSLESLGYEVHIATDGEDGWEKLNQNIPDLVLTDYEMPRLNGLQLTQRIKESEHYKHVPVIIISTHSTDEDKERGFQVGANDYLSKTEWNDDILNQAILRQIY